MCHGGAEGSAMGAGLQKSGKLGIPHLQCPAFRGRRVGARGGPRNALEPRDTQHPKTIQNAAAVQVRLDGQGQPDLTRRRQIMFGEQSLDIGYQWRQRGVGMKLAVGGAGEGCEHF
ncbi:Uncharacterised protein [Mycobacteroides abscessus subsp. abscessus]|nr:Uncharacterised protein [Mycobacteroides abscessus subsp. abscessus]